MKRAALDLRGLGLRSPRYAEGGGIAAGAVASTTESQIFLEIQKGASDQVGVGYSKNVLSEISRRRLAVCLPAAARASRPATSSFRKASVCPGHTTYSNVVI